MTREFILLKEFEKNWKDLGLDDDNLSDLQLFLCENPDHGNIIPGTGGLRKMRWFLQGRGKRGGARICYIDLIIHKKIYLITAYAKNEKENLSPDDKKIIKNMIALLETEANS